ncbi:MAG: hypothetical protein AAB508_01780 [Patescibacteria group bacterium]
MNYPNPDPYDSRDDIGLSVPMYTPNEITEEEKLYHELLGLYQACPDNQVACYDASQWEHFNGSMDTLVTRGHSDYARFKITPRINGANISYVNYDSFRMNMMSALRRMSQDFTLSDPNFFLYQYTPKGNTSIVNANTNEQHNSQVQHNEQRSYISLTVEQKIKKLNKEIVERLSPEQINQIEPLLTQFKNEPAVWSNAQKLITGVLGFGKDIAVNVIANVISFHLSGVHT